MEPPRGEGPKKINFKGYMDHGQNSVLSLEGSIHEAATTYTASLQSARSDIMVQGSTVGQMDIFGEDERRCGAPMNALRHCPGPVGPFPPGC